MDTRNYFTSQLLGECLEPGMRVLDVGCGRGEVSVIAADIVGNSGSVVGIDASAQALEMARDYTAQHSAHEIELIQLDAFDVAQLGRSFDAVIERRVLMYIPEASACVAALKEVLNPGGVMAFQESDSMGETLNSGFPIHQQAMAWIWETVRREGGDTRIGSRLYALLKENDMDVVSYRSEATLQTAETGSDLDWVVGMMADRMISHDVVTAEELDAETIPARLAAERDAADHAFVRDLAYGIIARKRA